MILDDRKKRILQAIVEDFVSTGEPVGSRTVAKKYNLGMSAATIRNDMADLEELGFLQQPHTSAGRVPSDLGYREYVDKIMDKQDLSMEEVSSIREGLETKLKEATKLIRQVTNVIAQITRYTSIAVIPQFTKSEIKHLQLVPIDKTQVLLVIVLNNGIVKNFIVKVNREYSPDFLYRISGILNEKFSGYAFENVSHGIAREIENETDIQKEVLVPIFKTLRERVNSNESEVHMEGTSNILNFPEFNDISKAKGFFKIIDEKDFIISLLNSAKEEKINVTIGSENECREFKDISIISTSYWAGGKLIGNIGVIGPTRMNYSKVITCIEYLRKELADMMMQSGKE